MRFQSLIGCRSKVPLLASVVALAAPVLLATTTAKAVGNTVDVYIEDATITSPVSTENYSLDVYVTTTPDSYSPQALSYNAQVTLSPTAGVTLLAPTPTTSDHPEAFPTGDFIGTSSLGTINADDDTGSDTPITLNNGDGLFQINYSVAANTTGTFNLDFTTSPPNIILDENNDRLAVNYYGGTITIAAVPEPASLALLGLCAPLLLRRRRRVA